MRRLSVRRYASAASTSAAGKFSANAPPASKPSPSTSATDIRNIALVAHIDSGKTTLTESILLASHYLVTPGSVDSGSTTTDFLPAERERGITIQAASIPVAWGRHTLNLVDTPGHADFGMEVESASRVVDGAVVLLDAVEGVEAQTKGVWRQLDRYAVPTRLVFLNKLDRPGASLRGALLSLLAHRFHPQPLLLALPVASLAPSDYASAEPGLAGVVDLVNWELCHDGARTPLPTNTPDLVRAFPAGHPLPAHLAPARTRLLESLGMHSEPLLDELLALPSAPDAYLSVPATSIIPHLRALTLRQAVLPVLCGSALKHIGTELLLDYVAALLASPLDVQHPGTQSTQVQLLAWKVTWDKRRGWMTFVRVYSGILTRGVTLQNVSRGERERVSKLLLLYASQPEEIESLAAGSIGVILGLKHTRTGDTLVSAWGAPSGTSDAAPTLRAITPPPAVISAAVIPHAHADLQPVQDALTALTRTDPSARAEEQDGQLLLHGLGALHLEIAAGRLRDEWGVRFRLGTRRVSYREGFRGEMRDTRTWETHLGVASVTLTLRALPKEPVRPGPWGDNVVVLDNGAPLPAPDAVPDPHAPLAHLAHGLHSALASSPHTGLPLSHVHLTLHGYILAPPAPSTVLAGAAAHALRALVREAGPGPLLEPYVRVKVEVGEDALGRVVRDLAEHRAEIEAEGASSGADDAAPYAHAGLYVPPTWLSPSARTAEQAVRLKRTVGAVAPLSGMLDYAGRLRALTGGHGVFEMGGAGFREVGEARRGEILREIGRA